MDLSHMPLRLPVALHHDALLRRTSSVLKWSGSRLLLIPIEAGRGGVSKLQEATMGTLVFVCPTTGHRVSTGVEVDRSSFELAADQDGDLLSALSEESYAIAYLGVARQQCPGSAGRSA